MSRRVRIAPLLAAVIASIALAVVAVFVDQSTAAPPDALQAVTAATARYHSFERALKDGYTVENEPCVASPFGSMGIHATNPSLMADSAIDPLRPEILLYLPDRHGKLKLVGVEFWKMDADGNLATNADRTSVLGQPFNGPMPGHNPTMPVHYDLHVWLWAENPSGMFAMFNPTLACPS